MSFSITIFTTCLVLLWIGCDKDDNRTSGFGYPEGMKVHDMQLTNDCTLPECSDERIVRLIANNVKGRIHITLDSQWVIFYTYTFDSVINFYPCNLPEEFKMDGIDVVYDGYAIDACGIRIDGWPVEEVYTLLITEIERQ